LAGFSPLSRRVHREVHALDDLPVLIDKLDGQYLQFGIWQERAQWREPLFAAATSILSARSTISR
jgi:hypothetical protein